MKKIEQEIAYLKELRFIVADLIASGGIGVFGVRNNNGADTMNCPACFARTEIMGYCSYSGTLDEVKEHTGDCRFKQLQEIIAATESMDVEDEDAHIVDQNDTRKYVILEGIDARNRFFSTRGEKPIEDVVKLITGEVAYSILGFCDTMYGCQMFLFGNSDKSIDDLE
jgi:hypothetical protein